MLLVDRIASETEPFHADADEEVLQLMGAIQPADYLRFLIRTYGFVAPLERSLIQTPDVARYTDVRRFDKHDLLRRDLLAFRLGADEIDRLPQCTVPLFDSVEEAFGWAYVVERSTLSHGSLFRHLASKIPGDVAFTSTYLKYYFGSLGETWRGFSAALEQIGTTPERARHVIEGAKTAFRVYRNWRHLQDDQVELAVPQGASG